MDKEQTRLYRLKDALRCNPTVGPSLILHWAKQGYLIHGAERHGTLERLAFSFSELVYLSLIARLSWLGAISKETTVSYPAAPSTKQGTKSTEREFTKLDSPGPVFTVLENSAWNKTLILSMLPYRVEGSTPRSKKEGIRYLIHIRDQEEVQREFDLWRSGFDSTAAMAFIDASRVKRWIEDTIAKK